MSKFPNWGVGTDVTGTNFAYMVPNIVTKASTSTYTTNTTLANDAELVSLSLAVGTYRIELMILVTGAAAGASNLKTGWAFSTGTLTGTPVRACMGAAATSTAAPSASTPMNFSSVNYNTAVTYGLGSTTVPAVIMELCPTFVVATAGTLAVQFAQGTSSATSTVVQPGTQIKIWQTA